MLVLSAKIRKDIGKKVKTLRKKGILPAVLYGPKIKNLNLEITLKEFKKVYKEAGKSSLIKLKVKSQKSKVEEFLVLLHDIQFDPLTEKPIHLDFYQPSLEEEVEIIVPLVFEGEALAVKELGGTLVKNITEIKIKTLPKNLLHQIKVDIGKLKTFDEAILVKDLEVPKDVKILKEAKEIIAKVVPPEKVEEELKKPIEEKIEEMERIEEKKPKGEKEEEV